MFTGMLERYYQAAITAHGKKRLERFVEVQQLADGIANLCIYGPCGRESHRRAYANLGHHFNNALMLSAGMHWRLREQRFDRRDDQPPYLPQELHAEIARCDKVMVDNGRDLIDLLLEAVSPAKEGAPSREPANSAGPAA